MLVAELRFIQKPPFVFGQMAVCVINGNGGTYPETINWQVARSCLL